MESSQTSRRSQALVAAFVCSFVLALVFALSALEFSASAGIHLVTGPKNEHLLDSSPSTGPARSLRLAKILPRGGALIPLISDSRPRVFTPSKPGACLKFIHIPKTGGTTIERVWRWSKHRKDPRVAGWGRHDEEATCTGNPLPNEREGDMNLQWYRRCTVPGGKCSHFHVPPRFDPLMWKTGYEGCDTFCVARHPLDRFESQWQYKTKVECNTAESQSQFNDWARLKLQTLSTGNLYIDDCHFLPANQFVFHTSPQTGLQRTCTHVLRFEHLTKDFAALMRSYNYTMTLKGEKANAKDTCKLNIPDDILEGVRAVYGTDYGIFGYD